MIKSKSEKGITLTTLVVTIVVLLILAGVATSTGIEAIENTKFTKFKAELKIMQSHVNQWYEDCKPSVNAQKYDETFSTNIKNKLTASGAISATSKEEGNSEKVQKAQDTLNKANIPSANYGNYYLLEENTKNSLGVEGVSQDVLVSVKDRKVVSYYGLKWKNKMYYTIDNQSEEGIGEVFNVEYDVSKNTGTASFELSSKYIGNGKTKIEVQNISFDGYNNKWYVKYKKQGNTNWSKQEGTDFNVSEDGIYQVKIENENINSEEQTIEVQMDPQIGDYVEYDVSYTDIYSDIDSSREGLQHYTFTKSDGWRIIDTGTKKADGSYKDVKIISTGIPAVLSYDYSTKTITENNSWWGTKEQVAELFDTNTIKYSEKGYVYKSNLDESGYPNAFACAGMFKNFLEIPFSQAATPSKNTCGYISIENDKAENNNTGYILKNDTALEIHILSWKELESLFKQIYNVNSYTPTNDTNGLFYLNNLNNYGYSNNSNPKYWLSTPSLGSGANVYYISNNERLNIYYNENFGIRPVITLKSDIYKDGDIWKIKQ